MKSQNKALLKASLIMSFYKLNPLVQWRNPVMFIVYLGSIFCTIFIAHSLLNNDDNIGFGISVVVWLWFTILFANFAEAYAESRSQAQSDSLKSLQADVPARKLVDINGETEIVMTSSKLLKKNDIIRVEQGEIIPMDGEVIEGIASVDESAITGESAPVIRASGSDFCSVTGGTLLVSDHLIIRINANPGESFLDQMVSMVEGAKRKKTPNEIALTILLIALSIIFILVVGSLYGFSSFIVEHAGGLEPISLLALVALLVCLIPTTIGGLLSAVGVAGMNRMMQSNVIATSGRAVESAGNIDVLLLDKTGTITFGNRQASEFVPCPNVDLDNLIKMAYYASVGDETPEGRSIIALAQQLHPNLKDESVILSQSEVIAFTAQTQMSGVNYTKDNQQALIIRKGSSHAISHYIQSQQGKWPKELTIAVEKIAASGATPLVVSVNHQVLGVIALKDIVKPGIRERFQQLRQIGIRTIMITGDNPLTAAAIALEAGVDDYLAEATPEEKLNMIRKYQAEGLLVAMTGDGTNDAPALAQADVAVAMNSGTQAAKEASNMVDLDSDPTKLIEIVKIGKQLLMTRGALTTFSIANDIAKYFVIIPALFIPLFPGLAQLNLLGLESPNSALLSAVIFNALIIVFLIPLAIKGVTYRSESSEKTLRRNLLIYGLGGLIVPFIAIKAIDIIISWL